MERLNGRPFAQPRHAWPRVAPSETLRYKAVECAPVEPIGSSWSDCLVDVASHPENWLILRLVVDLFIMKLMHLLPLATMASAACNGHDELCSRKYSDVTFVGSHDSAFVGETPTHNQYISVTDQLKSGVRFLQAQTHNKGGTIEMCHTYCWELDSGPLTQYLGEVADFMNGNANEVVTLLLTNGDAIPVQTFDAAFQSAGLTKYVLHAKDHMNKDQWPTMQQLLDADTRLIVFMGKPRIHSTRFYNILQDKSETLTKATDYHADQSKVDYILPEFDYYWETPYGITDKSFPTCSVDRPSNGDPQQLMGIVNHMLNFKIGDIVFPDQADALTTNGLDSITKQVNLCESQGKPQPNVILVSVSSTQTSLNLCLGNDPTRVVDVQLTMSRVARLDQYGRRAKGPASI